MFISFIYGITNSIQINSSIVPHPSKFSTNTANKAICKWLTGIASQVLLMNCSLSVDWLYVSVMLQLLRTPGTTHGIQGYVLRELNEEINSTNYWWYKMLCLFCLFNICSENTHTMLQVHIP